MDTNEAIEKEQEIQTIRHQKIDSFCDTILQILVTPILVPILFFGYQIYKYLKEGAWFSFSTLDFCKWVDLGFLKSSDPWVGVMKILDLIPFTISSVVILFVFSLILYSSLYGILKEYYVDRPFQRKIRKLKSDNNKNKSNN